MPVILTNTTSEDWMSRAEETRAEADKTRDPVTKVWLQQVAGEYERLAGMAKARAPNGVPH
jgi:hypothetical protein